MSTLGGWGQSVPQSKHLAGGWSADRDCPQRRGHKARFGCDAGPPQGRHSGGSPGAHPGLPRLRPSHCPVPHSTDKGEGGCKAGKREAAPGAPGRIQTGVSMLYVSLQAVIAVLEHSNILHPPRSLQGKRSSCGVQQRSGRRTPLLAHQSLPSSLLPQAFT